MEEKINDVQDILLSANMTSQSLASLQELITELRLVKNISKLVLILINFIFVDCQALLLL